MLEGSFFCEVYRSQKFNLLMACNIDLPYYNPQTLTDICTETLILNCYVRMHIQDSSLVFGVYGTGTICNTAM